MRLWYLLIVILMSGFCEARENVSGAIHSIAYVDSASAVVVDENGVVMSVDFETNTFQKLAVFEPHSVVGVVDGLLVVGTYGHVQLMDTNHVFSRRTFLVDDVILRIFDGGSGRILLDCKNDVYEIDSWSSNLKVRRTMDKDGIATAFDTSTRNLFYLRKSSGKWSVSSQSFSNVTLESKEEPVELVVRSHELFVRYPDSIDVYDLNTGTKSVTLLGIYESFRVEDTILYSEDKDSLVVMDLNDEYQRKSRIAVSNIPYESVQVQDFQHVSGNKWLIVGNRKLVTIVDAANQTTNVLSFLGELDSYGFIDFQDTKNGIIGLRNAGMAKTNDGGLSWQSMDFEGAVYDRSASAPISFSRNPQGGYDIFGGDNLFVVDSNLNVVYHNSFPTGVSPPRVLEGYNGRRILYNNLSKTLFDATDIRNLQPIDVDLGIQDMPIAGTIALTGGRIKLIAQAFQKEAFEIIVDGEEVSTSPLEYNSNFSIVFSDSSCFIQLSYSESYLLTKFSYDNVIIDTVSIPKFYNQRASISKRGNFYYVYSANSRIAILDSDFNLVDILQITAYSRKTKRMSYVDAYNIFLMDHDMVYKYDHEDMYRTILSAPDDKDKGKTTERKSALDVSLYPNPAGEYIVIESDVIDMRMIEFVSVTTIHGRVIEPIPAHAISANKTSIEVSDLPVGTYILEIQTGDVGQITVPFVVER